MQRLQKFEKNLRGRDLAVGDIHGCYSRLCEALNRVRFNPNVDRLFSVGDLVDRGPENVEVVNLVGNGWFFAVRGNHDDFAIRHRTAASIDEGIYRRNGGGWFIDAPPTVQDAVVAKLEMLPFAIQVETDAGRVGIVHADVPGNWTGLEAALGAEFTRDYLLWSRERYALRDTALVQGIDHLVVGHTPHPVVMTLGNVHYIDTGGWFPVDSPGYFTLLDLNTMQPI